MAPWSHRINPKPRMREVLVEACHRILPLDTATHRWAALAEGFKDVCADLISIIIVKPVITPGKIGSGNMDQYPQDGGNGKGVGRESNTTTSDQPIVFAKIHQPARGTHFRMVSHCKNPDVKPPAAIRSADCPVIGTNKVRNPANGRHQPINPAISQAIERLMKILRTAHCRQVANMPAMLTKKNARSIKITGECPAGGNRSPI